MSRLNKFMSSINHIENKLLNHCLKSGMDDFTQASSRFLSEINLSSYFNETELYEWFLSEMTLPTQACHPLLAGRFNISLASNEYFSINLNFYGSGGTIIHKHHFKGAFQVVQGESIQSFYSFKEAEFLSENLYKGELTPLRREYLKPGQVFNIDSNEIHQVGRLSPRCFSIVIKNRSSFSLPYSIDSFLLSGICIEKVRIEENFLNKLHLLNESLLRPEEISRGITMALSATNDWQKVIILTHHLKSLFRYDFGSIFENNLRDSILHTYGSTDWFQYAVQHNSLADSYQNKLNTLRNL